MGSRRSNPSVKPGQENPIDSNTIRSSSLRDYTPSSITKNHMGAEIRQIPYFSIPSSLPIEKNPPRRQPFVSSQNANGLDMPVTPKTIGRRLLRTRQALNLSQAEFCRQIGVERNL